MTVEFSKEDGIALGDGTGDADSGVRVEFAGSGRDDFSFRGTFFGLWIFCEKQGDL